MIAETIGSGNHERATHMNGLYAKSRKEKPCCISCKARLAYDRANEKQPVCEPVCFATMECNKPPVAMLPTSTGSIACKEANSVTKRIPLTRGYVALVDDKDYVAMSAHKWMARVSKHGVYASRRESRKHEQVSLRGRVIYMHRQLVGLEPAHENMMVDHVNGNTLDNRRANLRVVTAIQNSWNRVGASTRYGQPVTSAYRGVHKAGGADSAKWVAQITVAGRKRHLGMFTDEVTAARAFDEAAVLLYKTYARLNFPYDRGSVLPETTKRCLLNGENVPDPRAGSNQQRNQQIRDEYAKGNITQAELGRKYGLAQTTIGQVVRRVSSRGGKRVDEVVE